MGRVTVKAWDIQGGEDSMTLGNFGSVQLTNGTLRDDNDLLIAYLDDKGLWWAQGVSWTDITIEQED